MPRRLAKYLTRSLLAIAVLVAALGLTWWLQPELYIRALFPAPPDLPAPSQSLSAGQSGRIHFPTRTYYDLDILLADTATGTPANANGTTTPSTGTLTNANGTNTPANADGTSSTPTTGTGTSTTGTRTNADGTSATTTTNSTGTPATGVGDLFLPVAAGAPAPAMILAHGSGGIMPGREDRYARLLNRHGIAAFIINYYAPRGADGDVNYLTKVLSVTEFDVISDLYHALKILRTHPGIDPGRIGVMGMSYGGMAARFAVDQRIKRALIGGQPGFAAVIDLYGPCFQNLRSTAATATPMLTLRGTEDASNDLTACAKREQELRNLGLTVEAEIYEGAGHAWENDNPREFKDAPYAAGCEMVYDARGFSYVGDRAIIPPGLSPARATRILNRMRSRDKMAGCVHSGYIIGRDDDTKARADARIMTFLRQVL